MTQVQYGVWIGLLDGHVLAGQCPYLSGQGSSRLINLPACPMKLEKETCGKIHRKGILCGKCEPNYGPAVNSEISSA